MDSIKQILDDLDEIEHEVEAMEPAQEWDETGILRKFLVAEPKPTDSLFTIWKDGVEAIVTLRRNGEMEFGPSYTPDEAAKLFWDAIAGLIPETMLVRDDPRDE